MKSDNSSKNLPSVNMISEDTYLKGTLETKNDIRVAGTLIGEAKAKGRVIISSSGKIEGDVQAVDADIAGKVEGEVHVSNKLILRKSAVIDGDIYTKTILTEEGAKINGSFQMSDNIKNEIKTNGLSLASDDKKKGNKKSRRNKKAKKN